ncbi:hypothetical protein BEWA_004100 [Theileria equi strain WA]|uniref:Uncharacterized protein n=1 Tax=Theileria equi strain WA TaxID=1537102 RepID=L0AZI4_THEEQ|nr:hypothetical protein BEWA_004100 [Theileria equi strain WA]AFZ81002.1 hypothetical protein BEWA_004100 [Theileria equi strain WA]|eukprot:XP_004830668.1 hypothetical protein BEWA_004100 [Theileria equi strain WA]
MHIIEWAKVFKELRNRGYLEPGVTQDENQFMEISNSILTGETGELVPYDEVDKDKKICTIDISNMNEGYYTAGCDDKVRPVDERNFQGFTYYIYYTDVDNVYRFVNGESAPIGLPLVKNVEKIFVYFYPSEFGVSSLMQISKKRKIWYIRNSQSNTWERVFDPRDKPYDNRDWTKIIRLLERTYIPANVLDVSLFEEYRHSRIHPAFSIEISRVFTSNYYSFTHKKKEGGLFKVTKVVYKGSALEGIPPSDDLKSLSLYFFGRIPLESALLLVEMISHNDKCTYFHRKNAAQTWSPVFPAPLTERLDTSRITNQLDELKEKRFNGIEKYFEHHTSATRSEVINECLKSLAIGIFAGIVLALILYEISAVIHSPRTSLIRGFARLVSRCIGRIFPSIVRSRKGYKKVSIE